MTQTDIARQIRKRSLPISLRLLVAVVLLLGTLMLPALSREISHTDDSSVGSLPFDNSLSVDIPEGPRPTGGNPRLQALMRGPKIENTPAAQNERLNINRMLKSREEQMAILAGAILAGAWLIGTRTD